MESHSLALVRNELARRGVAFTDSPAAPGALLAEPSGLNTLASGPAAWILPHGGRLSEALADPLERHPRVLWLAQRDGAQPADWELEAAANFLLDRSLIPAPHGLRQRVDSFEGISRGSAWAAECAAKAGGGRVAQERAQDTAHELLANAILDAPVDAEGKPRYAHRRHEQPQIAPEDACALEVGAEANRLYVSVVDRFGRFGPGPLVKALRGIGGRAKVDSSGGGAGLGLRRLLESSELLAVRVRWGRATEVVAVISLGDERRRSGGQKSLFFRADGVESA